MQTSLETRFGLLASVGKDKALLRVTIRASPDSLREGLFKSLNSKTFLAELH
jgi:hypothetical protein